MAAFSDALPKVQAVNGAVHKISSGGGAGDRETRRTAAVRERPHLLPSCLEVEAATGGKHCFLKKDAKTLVVSQFEK
jgi:hypothetical protein